MVSPKDPTDYKGTLQPYVPIVRFPRAPRAPLSASADFKNPLTGKNYVIGQEWSDSSTGDIYKLRAITANLGDWFLLSSSSGGPTVDFAVPLGDSPVFPTAAGLMTFTSSGGTINITGTAASNSINFDLVGGTGAVDSVDVDFNTAPGTDPVVPDAAGLISVYGNTVTNATNANAPVATHSRAANQFQVDVQLATDLTGAPADPFDAGLCSFDDTAFAVDGNGYVTLVGGGGSPAYVATNVDGNMAPGTDPVVADGSGEITVTGAQVAAGTIGANVIDTYSGAANTYAVRVQQADTAATKDTTLNGVAHYNSNDFVVDEGFVSLIGSPPKEFTNLGISYSSPTFTIHSADGTALSSSNPGTVVIPSKTTPGTQIEYKIEQNYTFEDASGTSDITGNRFGLTTGIATDQDIPFFIWFVANDAETAVTPMITRRYTANYVTSTSNIGKPSSAIANQNTDWWALDDSITVGDYDTNPCIRVGIFRMRMDSSDDWTVQALSSSPGNIDGINTDVQDRIWTMPTGQFGATSGRYMVPNGGTDPTWGSQLVTYQFMDGNLIYVSYYFNNDGGADGSGAVQARIVTPFYAQNGVGSSNQFRGTALVTGSGVTGGIALWEAQHTANNTAILNQNGSYILYSQFGNGARSIRGTLIYRVRVG